MTIRHAWLQKHATPVASDGEFHWYPQSDAAPEIVERSRGVSPPAVLWELAPNRVVWAQAFAATAPTDARRYVGFVVSIVEGDGTAAELLHRLVAPPPRPWEASPAAPMDDLGVATIAAPVARALLDGGTAAVGDPTAPELPQLVASLEQLVPDRVAMTHRRGMFTAGAAIAPLDRVADLMLRAWNGDERAVAGWRLLAELAQVQDRGIDGVELDGDRAIGAALSDDERQLIGDARDFVRVLHLWGRGRLDRSPAAASLAARLSDALASRVLASYLAGDDGRAPVASARWYALLPAARRTALLATASARTPSLSVEDIHA
ncbi:MAG TPA: hypothetical protein VGO00_20335 [Kofleriaceae bacterium]|nr:hypothetical protein [Kofleriaceae bacterium]